MYAKYIDSHTVEPLMKSFVTYKGRVYTNPSPERIRAAGYLKVQEIGGKPSYDTKTQYLVPCYSVRGNFIFKTYEVADI
jgi:hypothetical protein